MSQPDLDDDDSETFDALAILDERVIGKRHPQTEYLIQWAGADPHTGEAYEPSWEPAEGCSSGLVEPWVEKKRNDPGVIGRVSKAFEIKLKRKEKEREREEREERKAASASASKRKRFDSDSDEYIDLRSRAPRSTGKVAYSSPRQGKFTRTAFDDFSPTTKSASRSGAREARENLSSALSDGDDTSTARPKKSRAITPDEVEERHDRSNPREKVRNKKLGPVPQPSPNVFRSYMGKEKDLPSSGTHPSQLEPISQFSSPIRERDVKIAVGTQSPLDRGRAAGVKAAEVKEKPLKVQTRIIDGVEVLAVDSDSEDEQEEVNEEVQEQRRDAEVEVEVAVVPLDEEADVAVEATVDGTRAAVSNACLWAECGKGFDNAEDLARHIRSHASEFAPEPMVGVPAPEVPAAATAEVVEVTTSKTIAVSAPEPLFFATSPTDASFPFPAEHTPAATAAVATLAESSQGVGVAEARVATLEVEIEKKEKAIAALERKVKNISQDLEFVRQQYQIASDRALQEVTTSTELSKKVDTLKSQLDLGLKQRALHTTAVAAQRDAEVKKLRLQIDLLLKQARLTDDKVRTKARKYPQLAERVDELETEVHQAKSALLDEKNRADKLAERNTELNELLSVLRAKQMGAFDADDDDEEDDDYDDDDFDEEESGDKFIGAKAEEEDDDEDDDSDLAAAMGLGADFTPSRRGSGVVANVDIFASSSLATSQLGAGVKDLQSISGPSGVGSEGKAVGGGVVEKWEDGGELKAIRCKWGAEAVSSACKRVFLSLEELAEHAKQHITDAVPEPDAAHGSI